MKIKKVLPFIITSFLLGTIFIINSSAQNEIEAKAYYTFGDAATYYNGISETATGKDLLGSLNSLNNRKRQDKIGYKSLPSFYKYTDYDPKYATTDSNGVTSGERLLSFYSATSATYSGGGMNKEHVWPDSRGGNKVEGDIHMPRPTVSKENGSRGNSFYVEGMKHSSSGWDPAMESFGDETYRGDSARIIFYCAIADTGLTLIDATNDSTGNHTMGKLSDLIKWHLQYPITQREKNRNEGAEYLQGNRNPFIDHPEYVCRIWGKTNSTTQSLCANDPYNVVIPTSINLSETSLSLRLDETASISVDSVYPNDASTNVVWSSQNNNIATVDSNGLITAVGLGTTTITASSYFNSSVKASCTVTVIEPDPIELLDFDVNQDKIDVFVGNSVQIGTIFTPNYVYPKPNITYTSSDSSIAKVSSAGLVTGVSSGSTQINVSATQNEKVFNKTIDVNVSIDQSLPTYSLITSNSQVKTGDKIVLATSLEEHGNGIKGFNGNKDGEISESRDEWVDYQATSTSSGFKLYDSKEQEYIATPSTNEFKYDLDGGVCTVDSSGHIICNGRYLCRNGNYIRFYGSIGSYAPFYAYKHNFSYVIDDEPTLVSIEAKNYSSLVYVGEQYQYDGIVIAHYSDGTSKEISDYVVSNVSTEVEGTVTVSITYSEDGLTKITNFTISVREKESQRVYLESITVEQLPNKVNYVVNEKLDLTGLVVKANYSDDSSVDVTSFISVDTYDLYEVGTKKVTIYYEEDEFEVSTSFNVYVREQGVSEEQILVSITVEGQSTEIEVGKEYKFDGTVTAHYSNGTSLPAIGYILKVNPSDKPNTFIVTITYTEDDISVSASYEIKIKSSSSGEETPSENSSKGCGGSIATTSVILSSISLIGIGLISIKKKRK